MIYALLGEVVLGLGDGECGDAAAGGAGGFDGEATPAAADFENVVVGLDVGESDELVDFGFLGVGEGLIGVLEEGGGVEHGFGVEKGLVEVVAEIVVGLNVFSAAGFGVSVGGVREEVEEAFGPAAVDAAFFQRVNVVNEEAKQSGEVGGVPVVVGIGFSESNVARKDDLGEEGVVGDVEVLGVVGVGLPVLFCLLVGQGEVERAMLYGVELAVDEGETLFL